jgi:hypothetical protein
MRHSCVQWFAAALMLLIGLGVAPSGAATSPRSNELALHPYVGKLRTVQVEIEGRVATLIFDTGAGITSVTPEFAAQIGCEPRGYVSAFRMNGERVAFQLCPSLNVQIGGAQTERNLGVFDLGSVLPQGLPHVDGIAGLDLFDGRTITILPGLSGLRLETRSSLRRAVGASTPARLRMAREAGGIGLTVFCPARSRQGDVWLLLDSANLAGVRLHPWAVAAVGGSTEATRTSRVQLSIEGAAPETVDAEIVDELIYDGALNADFLERRAITLDLERGRAWWRPPSD